MTKDRLRQLVYLKEDIDRLSVVIANCNDMKVNGFAVEPKNVILIEPDTFNDEKTLQAVCDAVSNALSLVYDRMNREFKEA